MPKWRTVSFVPGVTLNIEDSTSVEPMVRPNDIFHPRSSEYDIGKEKKIPAYLDLSVLATLTLKKIILVGFELKYMCMSHIPFPHIAISSWVAANLRACFGHLGSDRPDPNFYRRYQLFQIELVNN